MGQLVRRRRRHEAVEDQCGRVLAHLLQCAQQRQARVLGDGALDLALRAQRRGRRPRHAQDLVLQLLAHRRHELFEDGALAHLVQTPARGRRPAPGHGARRRQLDVDDEGLGAPVGARRERQRLGGAPPGGHPARGQDRARQGQRDHALPVRRGLGVGVGHDRQVRRRRRDGRERGVAAHHQPRRARGLHGRRDGRGVRLPQARHAAGPVRQAPPLGQARADGAGADRGARAQEGARHGGAAGRARAQAARGRAGAADRAGAVRAARGHRVDRARTAGRRRRSRRVGAPAALAVPALAAPLALAVGLAPGLGHGLRQRPAHRRAHRLLGAPRQALLQGHEILAAVDLPAPVVQGDEGDAQVVGQALDGLGPVGVGDLDVPQPRHGLGEGPPEGDRRRAHAAGAVGPRDPLADGLPHLRARVRGGHEPTAHPLGQGADGGHHQLGARARHEPVEAVGAQAPQHLDGHPHGDAVVGGAR